MFKKKFLNKTIELNFSSPFELLIAVLLSAKTTDISVNKVTKELYLVANTPIKMLNLGITGIKKYIKSIGLFNKKAKFIFNICYILLNKYQGNVPKNRKLLEELPGIGRKTANVVLNVAFGFPTIAVDTHVFRFCNRSNFASGKNVSLVEEKLLKVVPKIFKLNCHNLLILHARYTCTAKNPHCQLCSIENLCEFKYKNFKC